LLWDVQRDWELERLAETPKEERYSHQCVLLADIEDIE